jgi:UDP-N-acetyl-D-glucosamine/UDP-N-acetyl-D-galactosamine dehydrogenase
MFDFDKSYSDIENKVLCVVGLGYVGLPLAIDLAKHFKVICFDIDDKKIKKLSIKYKNLVFTSNPEKIRQGNIVIIAVPTPVTPHKEPDMSYLIKAGEIVGKNLSKGSIVVLESTVFPGATEDILIPVIEKHSLLKVGSDFKIGYSPERINPGDKINTLGKITKIVSGMDKETEDILVKVYSKITNVYKADNIRTAEAAKVIENIQRDLNIALMNELSMIFNKMDLDSKSVLDAASTKWNFHNYKPGLVGGHCISVDPYYLVYKAKEMGYHPQVVLAGRSVNDNMHKYVTEMVVKGLNAGGKVIKKSNVLILGMTYKENVADTRESPGKKIAEELSTYNPNIYFYDPVLNEDDIKEIKIKSLDYLDIKKLNSLKFDAIIVTVSHDVFKTISLDKLRKIMNDKPVIVDVRRLFDKNQANKKGFIYLSL